MSITTSGLTEGDFGLLYKVDATPTTTLVDSLIVPNTSSLTYSVGNTEDGAFDFYVAAIDVAGNTSANSASTTITIDQTAPDVSTAAIDLVDNSDTGLKIMITLQMIHLHHLLYQRGCNRFCLYIL